MNFEKTEISHIVTLPTDDLDKIKKKHSLKQALSYYDALPEIAEKEYFDYIIVSDTVNAAGSKNRIVEELERLGVPNDKIINFSNFGTIEFFGFYNLVKYFLSDRFITERNKACGGKGDEIFMVTGVSHAYAGTDISEFSMPGIKLALTSQDLFYDYELAKLAINHKKGLKYAIIGVSPFSLHYDLSKSVNVGRCFGYYPMVKSVHNCPISESKIKELFNEAYIHSYDLFDSELIAQHLFGCNSLDKAFTLNDLMEVRKKLADAGKQFPETAIENKIILRNYVTDCIKADVLPILVIYPVSEFYNKYFSLKKFSEVRGILEDYSEEFNIPFYDFSNDKRFTISDFFDVEHLNVRGAEKISQILDKVLSKIVRERR